MNFEPEQPVCVNHKLGTQH